MQLGLTVLTIAGVAISIIVGVITLYEKLVKPKLRKTKHHHLYGLIKKWFDEIDQNLDSGLNMDKLNNYEKDISDFIRDNKLDVPIRCSKAFIDNYLKHMGIKKELRSDIKLFNNYSRNAQGTFLYMYWIQILSNFSNFHTKYSNGEKDINFSNIEEPVKFLKRYFKV